MNVTPPHTAPPPPRPLLLAYLLHRGAPMDLSSATSRHCLEKALEVRGRLGAAGGGGGRRGEGQRGLQG